MTRICIVRGKESGYWILAVCKAVPAKGPVIFYIIKDQKGLYLFLSKNKNISV